MTPKQKVQKAYAGAFAARFLDGWIIWIPNKGNLTPSPQPTPKKAWHFAWVYQLCYARR